MNLGFHATSGVMRNAQTHRPSTVASAEPRIVVNALTVPLVGPKATSRTGMLEKASKDAGLWAAGVA